MEKDDRNGGQCDFSLLGCSDALCSTDDAVWEHTEFVFS